MPQKSAFSAQNPNPNRSLQPFFTPLVWLSLILLLGTSLRFYALGTKNYWLDEIFTITEAQQSTQQLLTSGRLDQPVAYFLPFQAWIQFFGTSEVSTRAFSTLAGIGAIVLIYWVGREVFGKSVGLWSAFLLAISEFQIGFSQEARFYTLFELLSLLSFLFFILALKKQKALYFAIYVVASSLMLYSHTFGVFILAAQNLFFLLRIQKYRKLLRPWLISQGGSALALLPSLYLFIFGMEQVGENIASNLAGNPVPSFIEPFHTLYRFVLPLRHTRSWAVFFANYALAFSLLAAGVWFSLRRARKSFFSTTREIFATGRGIPDQTDWLLLLGCWLIIPILFPFIFSRLLGGSFYADRYTLSAAPALYLLLAFGLEKLRKLVPATVSIIAILILVAPSLSLYYQEEVYQQWRAAAQYVEANSSGNEVLVFVPEGTQEIYIKSFNWYYTGPLESCGLKSSPETASSISTALLHCISGHPRFWVIKVDPVGTNDPYQAFFTSNPANLHLLKEGPFLRVTVYLFEQQP